MDKRCSQWRSVLVPPAQKCGIYERIETWSFSERWGLFMALDILVYDSEVINEHKIFLMFGSCNRAKADIQQREKDTVRGITMSPNAIYSDQIACSVWWSWWHLDC